MALRLAVAADAPKISAARNAWAALRPDIYGTNIYTPQQALTDITAGVQRVHIYESGTPLKLRGFIITNEQTWWDPDAGDYTMAIRIGDLVVDPAIFSTANLRTVMQALKGWGLAHRPLLRRLCGEAVEPSPIVTYFRTVGCRFISSVDNGDGTTTHSIDRIFTAGTG